MSEVQSTDKYKYCNHHHELTENHELVTIGSATFVANREAIPLLQALNDLGLTTRTHHVSKTGECFISVLLSPGVSVEIREVNEKDSTRTEFNGQRELLIAWSRD